MVEVKLQDKPILIRSSWNDVTMDGYCDIVLASQFAFMQKLCIYTGIEDILLNKLTMAGIKALIEIVQFMDAPDTVYAFAHGYTSEFNIGHQTYGKLEEAKQVLVRSEHPIKGAAEVVKIYTGEDIGSKPVTQVIGQASFYVEALKTFLEKYKRLGEWEPSMEEYEAGVEQLSAFGAWGTATAYARRTNMKPDEVFDLEASKVYTTLLLDFEQSEYERRLNEIRARNARMNNP